MRRTLALALVSGLFVAGAAIWGVGSRPLVLASDWLMVGDPPVVSDLIVVLSGGAGERYQTAIQLYGQGMAPFVMLTSPAGFPDQEARLLVSQGIPYSALVMPLRPARNTREDAASIREVILRKGFRSLLIVTSPYHCRRTRLIMQRQLSGLGVRYTVTPSVSLYLDPNGWWRTRQGWITLAAEFPKLLWAWATVPVVR